MPRPNGVCAVVECGGAVYADGLCRACYVRRLRDPEGFDPDQPRKRDAKARQADHSALIRTLRQERDEARGKLKIAEQEAERRYARLWTVAQALWLRLSTMNGWAWMLRDSLPREDTIPANCAALEAGRTLGLGED